MEGFNQVVLMGTLGNDPKLRFEAGLAVCHFQLVVPRYVDGKERKTDTIKINVTVWRRMAEICSQHLVKGSDVLISGRLQHSKAKGYRVAAERIQFLKTPTPKWNLGKEK